MNIHLRAALLLAVSSVSITACSQADTEAETAATDGIAGLTITEARVVLPPVAGNPAAAYFTMAYDGDRSLALRNVDVAGAQSAMLHEYMEYNFEMQMVEMMQLPIKSGESVTFEPGGRHLMVFDLSEDLKEGGNTEITLTFAGGDKHSFNAEIRGPGEDR